MLQQHLPTIIANWKKLSTTPEELLWFQTNHDHQTTKNFASVTLWKQSNRGLFSQHLVSTGRNPALSLRTMMAAQYKTENDFTAEQMNSSQNWFRPENRYAERILGSMVERLGEDRACRIIHHYLHLPEDVVSPVVKQELSVSEITEPTDAFIDFVRQCTHPVFVIAEELDQNDLVLEGLNGIYAAYGLSRHRKIFVVHRRGAIVACLVANRAPIGTNFSLLGNRCYLLMDGALSMDLREDIVRTAVPHISEAYASFTMNFVPMITDEVTAEALLRLGARFYCRYTQSIWLRSGFSPWHDHIGSFLDRIASRFPT